MQRWIRFQPNVFLNELGITNVFMPVENTPNGNSVAPFDKVPDPEDDGTMVHALARFMRSTKAPPRDEVLAATPQGSSGSALFDLIGCPICHVRDIHTALLDSGKVTERFLAFSEFDQ